MDPRPIRWGRGKGGHSAESKSIEPLELLELLELDGICRGGCRESLEWAKGGAAVGRCSREWRESGEHDGRRVWRDVVPDGRGMVFLMPTSRLATSNDCDFVQPCLVLLSVGLFILPPTEE